MALFIVDRMSLNEVASELQQALYKFYDCQYSLIADAIVNLIDLCDNDELKLFRLISKWQDTSEDFAGPDVIINEDDDIHIDDLVDEVFRVFLSEQVSGVFFRFIVELCKCYPTCLEDSLDFFMSIIENNLSWEDQISFLNCLYKLSFLRQGDDLSFQFVEIVFHIVQHLESYDDQSVPVIRKLLHRLHEYANKEDFCDAIIRNILNPISLSTPYRIIEQEEEQLEEQRQFFNEQIEELEQSKIADHEHFQHREEEMTIYLQSLNEQLATAHHQNESLRIEIFNLNQAFNSSLTEVSTHAEVLSRQVQQLQTDVMQKTQQIANADQEKAQLLGKITEMAANQRFHEMQLETKTKELADIRAKEQEDRTIITHISQEANIWANKYNDEREQNVNAGIQTLVANSRVARTQNLLSAAYQRISTLIESNNQLEIELIRMQEKLQEMDYEKDLFQVEALYQKSRAQKWKAKYDVVEIPPRMPSAPNYFMHGIQVQATGAPI